MPKMKTVKAASKRFTRTGTGKIRRHKAFATHLLKNKSPKRKRNFRRATLVDPADVKRIERMIQ